MSKNAWSQAARTYIIEPRWIWCSASPTRSRLLTLLEECGCVETAAQTASTLSTKVGEAFGKALIGAVVNKAIERSAVKFVSVLL